VRLSPVAQKYILHWGEMGTRWGVNRTVAQISALLYLSQKPVSADEIASTLSVARSNVSTSLRELQSWGIVHIVHLLGDRRDHFESLKSVCEMFRIVLDERKRREVDPTLRVLRECLAEAGEPDGADAYTKERLREMLNFFEAVTALYEQLRPAPVGALIKLARSGAQLRRLLTPTRGKS